MAYDVYEPDGTQTNLVLAIGVLFLAVAFLCVFMVQGCIHSHNARKDLDILVRRVERLEAVPK